MGFEFGLAEVEEEAWLVHEDQWNHVWDGLRYTGRTTGYGLRVTGLISLIDRNGKISERPPGHFSPLWSQTYIKVVTRNP